MSHSIGGRVAGRSVPRRGFTLLEVLIATVITLILTALVVEMFQVMSDGIFNSRANIELSDMLRSAKHRLIQDLRGVTAPTVPPLDPAAEQGYFEYVEGPGVANSIGGDTGGGGKLTNNAGAEIDSVNTVLGDLDDILMFTTSSFDEPFVGRYGNQTVRRSRFAEVAWFVRKAPLGVMYTLHRRIFLIQPINLGTSVDEYREADYSMRQAAGLYDPIAGPVKTSVLPHIVPNSLGDLTMRERRSLHQPYSWPHEMMYIGEGTSSVTTVIGVTTFPKWNNYNAVEHGWKKNVFWSLGLPTNREHSGSLPDPLVAEKNVGGQLYQSFRGTTTNTSGGTTTVSQVAPNPFLDVAYRGVVGSRESDDVVLANVVGFDVKAWDPGAPVFRAAPADAASGMANDNNVGLIVPGDGGYNGDGKKHGTTQFPFGALYHFANNTGNPKTWPVAFGAYADLNYMWLNARPGEENVDPSNAGQLSAMKLYYQALVKYENATKIGSSRTRLPRPSFGFANPNRVLSGYPGRNASMAGYQYPAVWDTWSRHYEYDGIDNDEDGRVDEGFNGIDDNNNGLVDEPPVATDGGSIDHLLDPIEIAFSEANGERDAPPPYDAPLRGIKVTIRVMEQDSRQVREVSTVHEFIPF